MVHGRLTVGGRGSSVIMRTVLDYATVEDPSVHERAALSCAHLNGARPNRAQPRMHR